MKKIVLLWTTFPLSMGAQADTLATAIDKAIGFNPSHQSEIRIYEKELQNQRISDGALIPKVELQGSNTRSKTRNLAMGRDSFGETHSRGLVVSQTLYKGGAIWAGRTQTKYKIKRSYASLRSKEQSLILSVVSAYTGVLTARQTQTMRQELLTVAQNNLNTVRERSQAELANREELLDAQSKFATATANKFSADAKLQLAENQYFTVVGEKAPQKMQSLETLAKLSTLKLGTIDETLQKGLKHNPDVQSARLGVEVAKQAMLIKRGSLLPSVSVRYNHTIHESATNSTTDSLSISTKIPLYQQGAAWAQLEQARLDQRRALNSLETAKLTNERNIRRYWFDIESLKRSLKAYQLALNTSNERVKIAREEFQGGTKTLSDLTKAESDATSARISYLTSLKDTLLARYRLQAAVGILRAEAQFNPKIEKTN